MRLFWFERRFQRQFLPVNYRPATFWSSIGFSDPVVLQSIVRVYSGEHLLFWLLVYCNPSTKSFFHCLILFHFIPSFVQVVTTAYFSPLISPTWRPPAVSTYLLSSILVLSHTVNHNELVVNLRARATIIAQYQSQRPSIPATFFT